MRDSGGIGDASKKSLKGALLYLRQMVNPGKLSVG